MQLLLRDEVVAKAVLGRRENPRYLPGRRVHDRVVPTTSFKALEGKDIVVLAVPCQFVRHFLRGVGPMLREDSIIVNAAKGLEAEDCTTVGQIVAQELPQFAARYAILSGPSFAVEVMDNSPTAVVLGCADEALGTRLRETFSSSMFRCYSSTDVRGVELGGALKNVMAIAAGVCDALGFGHNARAAMITRGLGEMSRLGVALGGKAQTFMGLSGLGDLMLTCTGDLSRNRQVGLRLGKGERLERIVQTLGMVAEGVKTTLAVHALIKRTEVEAPIFQAVYNILYGQQHPMNAVIDLMTRSLKAE